MRRKAIDVSIIDRKNSMKKSLIFTMLLILSLGLYSQDKKVAVMETKAGQGVSAFQANMIRGGMETAIANAKGYEGFDRSAFDIIMKEQGFQRSGAVDEAQIKELGQMAGVQYILVTEAESEDGYLYILAKILDVETGKYGKAYDKLCESNPASIRQACLELGERLFDVTMSYHNVATPPKPNYNNTQTKTSEGSSSMSGSNSKVGEMIVFPDGTQGIIFYLQNGRGLAISLIERELKWDNNRKPEDIVSLDNIDENNHPFIYGEGKASTQAIIQKLGTNAEAASWCTRMGEDWYMPSLGEFYYLTTVSKKGTPLFNKLNSMGVRLNGWYWTSTEHNKKEAINVSDGGWTGTEDKNAENKVRAIRAFTE